MPTTKIYENRAILIDPNEYANGWEHPMLQIDFVTAAIEECHNFLPSDWYVEGFCGSAEYNNITIVVGLKRYKDRENLQPLWNFRLIADPIDEDGEQWIVFDVTRWEPNNLYSFQLP